MKLTVQNIHILLLLSSAFFWNLALAIISIIVPLYAYHLGYSSLVIGSLVSLPVIAQIATRFVGGLLADWWGEKKLLVISYLLMILVGIMMYYSTSLLPIMIAQFISMISRGIFWNSSQTMISRFPGEQGSLMGKLNAGGNIGQVVGMVLAGIIAGFYGFNATFLWVIVIGVVALLLLLKVPAGDSEFRKTHKRANPYQHFKAVFLIPSIYFAIFCSFVGSQPYSLGASFYPVFLAKFGYESQLIGSLLAVRIIGGVVVGLFIAKYLDPFKGFALQFIATMAIGLSLLFTPMGTGIISIILILFIVGIGSEMLAISYQITASNGSSPAMRATALSVSGLGWSVSHLITPILFGYMVDTIGMSAAFQIWGCLVLVGFGTAMYFIYKRSIQSPITKSLS